MMQVTKVWWDGEKLMAEPIDPTTIYQEPAQEKDWGAVGDAHIAAIKKSTKAMVEDAVVRAAHKVMAEFEAKLDERFMEPPPDFIDALKYDVARRDSEFFTHCVDQPYDWSEWVCPDPKGYLMKCCDCGLVHEAEFGVVRYKSETEREDCDMVDDPNLQAVFRMRRSEQWSPADTAHRAGGLTMEQPAQQEPVAWKLVPREPTHEMLKAMDECSTEGYDERLYAGHAASVYMAAVDAAPTPPAQPQQEPVVWMYVNKSTHETKFQKHMRDFVDHSLWSEVPLYGEPLANHEFQCVCGAVWCGDEMVHLPDKRPPAQRKPLTDEEIILIVADCASSHQHTDIHFARAIEAKLKEKNNG